MVSSAVTAVPGAGLSPEWALHVACARMHMDPRNAQCVAELLQPRCERDAKQRGLDWDEVWLLARRHRTMPLLYRHLQEGHAATVPPHVMERLRNAVQSNTVRSYQLAGQLLQVLRRLQSQGVSAVAYRGPVLAEMAYGSPGMRQFDDLDILVPRQEVRAATEALATMGYRVDLPEQVTPAAYAQTRHHYALSRGHGQPLLELHWAIAPGYFHFALDAGIWD
ncbi:MAG: nucleotidyltransferase family protein, partial [Chloroflexi bacterium]|nr:nucleotidyltransferase family protein [Chloroflexota bacterium]